MDVFTGFVFAGSASRVIFLRTSSRYLPGSVSLAPYVLV